MEPFKRSRSLRRVKVKTKKGNTIHYKRRKGGKAKCANCRNPLSGTVHKKPIELSRIAKSKKRPERPFGGVLCAKCTTELIKERARNV